MEITKEAIEVTTIRKILIKRGVYGFKRKPMAMKLTRTRKTSSQTCPQMEVTTRVEETMKRDNKPKKGECIERSREDPQKHTSRGKGGDDIRMIGGEETRIISGDETRTIGEDDARMTGGDEIQTRGGDDTRTREKDGTRGSRNENKGGEDDERINPNSV